MKKKSLSILHRYRDHLLEREQINLQEKIADENNQKPARLLQLQARVKATHEAKASAKTVEEMKSLDEAAAYLQQPHDAGEARDSTHRLRARRGDAADAPHRSSRATRSRCCSKKAAYWIARNTITRNATKSMNWSRRATRWAWEEYEKRTDFRNPRPALHGGRIRRRLQDDAEAEARRGGLRRRQK